MPIDVAKECPVSYIKQALEETYALFCSTTSPSVPGICSISSPPVAQPPTHSSICFGVCPVEVHGNNSCSIQQRSPTLMCG